MCKINKKKIYLVVMEYFKANNKKIKKILAIKYLQ